MPYTPFHLPASAVVGWPFRRHLDLPVFLLVNLAMDLEPLLIGVFDLRPLPHGPVHTLLGGTIVGAVTGWVLWRGKGLVESTFGGPYPLSRRGAVVSGITGGWLHVLLDSIMYSHLRPFAPLEGNPLFVPGSGDALHVICAALLVPAVAVLVRRRWWRTVPQRLTVGLLGLSAVWMAAGTLAGAW